MRDVRKLLVLVLLLVGAQSTLSQRGPDRISVQLSMEKNQYVVGKRIRVSVRIQNRSDQPLIVSNVVLNSDNRSGHINFFVTDDQGMTHTSKIEYVGDSFAPFPSKLDVVQLISKWTVLYPNSSVTSILDFDQSEFPVLSRPGRYTLAGDYSSAGLSYPENYKAIGLTSQEIESMRYASWSGKIHSNVVSFSVVAPSGSP